MSDVDWENACLGLVSSCTCYTADLRVDGGCEGSFDEFLYVIGRVCACGTPFPLRLVEIYVMENYVVWNKICIAEMPNRQGLQNFYVL